jgi:hypothetical protein
MNRIGWILLLSLIAIFAFVGGLFYFSANTPKDSEVKLNLNNLKAETTGDISFNVTLTDGDSAVLENIVVNTKSYYWSDGSNLNSTILKGETKHWNINTGTLENGTILEITVKTQSASINQTVTVKAPETHNEDNESKNVYDYYGAVGLFPEGIHVIASEKNPIETMNNYDPVNSFWETLAQKETNVASKQKIISIILSRGDKPTGGYNINIESFSWLESYPIKLRFQVNVTDPGEDVAVTQALTNPLVLIPIGKLDPGEYQIEANITWFTETFDENGKPIYTPIMTFAPIQWKQTLTITEN